MWVERAAILSNVSDIQLGVKLQHLKYNDEVRYVDISTYKSLLELGKITTSPPSCFSWSDAPIRADKDFQFDDMTQLIEYYKKNIPERDSWDKYFMDKAVHASTRATCLRLSVGAVLVRGKRDIVTGYNGSAEGEPHCTEVGCLIYAGSCKRTTHAEMNIIDFCAKKGIPMEGTVLYVTHYPCPDCMQHIANSGVVEVVYKHFYKHKFNNNFSKRLKIRQFNEK